MSLSSSRVVRFPDQPVRLFGKYSLLAKLGQGGMADVFLAMVRGPGGFNKLVVVKRLKPDVAEDPEYRTMFQDEGRLASRLNHANIVQAHEVGEIEGHYYLAMEYLEGQPVNRIVARGDRLPARPVADYLRLVSETLAGLHYAHELADFDGSPLKIVHRDVSPHNIFVTYDGQVKVVDFGIAKAATRTQNTSTGVVKGKISYMAPEQALCAPIDGRADVFSTGVILWELLSGQRFWGDLSEVQILKKMAFAETPTLSEAWPDAPAELVRICCKALEMVPDDRYATALAFKQDIDAYRKATGQVADATSLGTVVADLFADRRQEVRQIISERMNDDPSEALPSLDLRADASSQLPAVQVPASVRRAMDGAPPSTSGIIQAEPPSVSTGGTSTSMTQVRLPVKPRWPLVLAAVVALGVGAGAWLLATSPEDETSPADDGAVAGDVMSLTIEAEPTDAEIFVDDARVPSNPFSAKFARDGQAHRIRVEADGFKTHSEMVVFEGDLTRRIALKPDAPSDGEGDEETDSDATDTATDTSSETATATDTSTESGAAAGTGYAPPSGWPPPTTSTQATATATGGPNVMEDDPWGKKP